MKITVGEFTDILRSHGVSVRLRKNALILSYNGKQAHIEPADFFAVLDATDIRYYVGQLELEHYLIWMDFPDLFGIPSKPPPEPPSAPEGGER